MTSTTVALSDWTNPRTGQTRRYVRNLGAVIGLAVIRRGAGSISSATFEGEQISNAAAASILGLKVWLDGTDAVHVDGWSGGTERYVTSPEDIAARVASAYATL